MRIRLNPLPRPRPASSCKEQTRLLLSFYHDRACLILPACAFSKLRTTGGSRVCLVSRAMCATPSQLNNAVCSLSAEEKPGKMQLTQAIDQLKVLASVNRAGHIIDDAPSHRTTAWLHV